MKEHSQAVFPFFAPRRSWKNGARPADLRRLFAALARSKFRSRMKLDENDRAYLETKGLGLIMNHAMRLLAQRLFPAEPVNDGKQVPMRGHPVFVAQHATATCCRCCLAKWHGIPPGRPLTPAEQKRVLDILYLWLEKQLDPDTAG